MTANGHKTASEGGDFLIDVARSIGSTLGSVAAKVSSVTSNSPKPRPRRRKVARKVGHTAKAVRRSSLKKARVSESARKPVARPVRRKRAKSSR
jgi:hypothetical protein